MRNITLGFGLGLLYVAAVLCIADFAQTASPIPSASVVAPAIIPPVLPINALPNVPDPGEIPLWLQQLMQMGMALPLVGPYLVKIMQYLGVIASLTTTACAFLLSVLKILQGVSSLAGLQHFSDEVTKFKDGKIVFYLKYLSLFNAPKSIVAEAKPAEVSKVG